MQQSVTAAEALSTLSRRAPVRAGTTKMAKRFCRTRSASSAGKRATSLQFVQVGQSQFGWQQLTKCATENSHGKFPRGGQCKVCGQNDHLARDCPKLQTAAATSAETGADDDAYHTIVARNSNKSGNAKERPAKRAKPAPKVVQF